MTHVAETRLGIVYTVSGFVTTVGTFPAGHLLDRVPGHIVLAFSVLSQAVGLWFLPNCTSLVALIIVYCIPASTFNCINLGGNLLIAWVKPKNPGPYLNLIDGGFGLGSFVGPGIAYLCGQWLGSSVLCFRVVAILAVLVGIALCCLPSPPLGGVDGPNGFRPPPEATRNSEQLEEGSAEKMLLMETAEIDAATFAEPIAQSNGDDRGEYVPQVSWPVCIPCALLVLLNVGTSVGVGAWVHTYTLREAQLGESWAATTNTTYWAAFTFGRFAAAALASVLTPIAIILPSTVLAIVSLLALIVLSNLCFAHPVLLCCLLFVAGIGFAPGFANAFALLARYSMVSGAANGVISAASGAGTMIIPALLAFAVHSPLLNPKSGSYQVIIYISMLSAVLQVLVAIWAEVSGRVVYYSTHHVSEPSDSVLDLTVSNVERQAAQSSSSAGAGERAISISGARSSLSRQRSSLGNSFYSALSAGSPSTLCSLDGQPPDVLRLRSGKLGSLV